MDLQKFKRKPVSLTKAFEKGKLYPNPFKSIAKIIQPIQKQIA